MVSETYHPDRNRQFEYIGEMKKHFFDIEQPIISVDSKKKELVGNFKNPGRKWSKEYDDVLNHDFRSKAIGIATPYGIYDMIKNKGLVVVGTSYDTAKFAVESIEYWLTKNGFKNYLGLNHILILCDSGGSNGYRVRQWKYALYYGISCKYNIEITVCHYPSGASKWNPIDHRLFSFININWQAEPLRSFEIILNLISQTKTDTGLAVDAVLNEKQYEKGIKISDEQMDSINIKEHNVLPKWNYTIYPN